MNVDAYLDRLDYQGSRAPTLATLRALHQAHLLAVPFENLDIHLGHKIVLDEGQFYDKIVTRRRGGFCYELNGLFASLLRTLGFDVTLLSARVTTGKGDFGPEFDHLVLLVQIDNPLQTGPAIIRAEPPAWAEARWLADVGFGDGFRDPLRLDDPEPQIQAFGAYRVSANGDQWTMLERGPEGQWNAEGYAFSLQPRQLAEFTAMCHWQQTAPESHFTQKRVCSRARPDGRITLSDTCLITTTQAGRQERRLGSEAEVRTILKDQFGIE